jgi:transketolase
MLELFKRANAGHIGTSLSCLEILVDLCFLAAHPPCSGKIRAIPFGTGSLGHGLGLACGLAFSQRFTKRPFRVFAVLSDGDCNEGSTWEAVLFAAHQNLSTLTVVIDLNGIQGLGHTRDILNLEPIVDKWRAFGFAVGVAENGNDFDSLALAHESVESSGGPRCIIARTVKGHGVSYMANRVEWHYLPMGDEQYATALAEIGSSERGPACQ